ncbi:twin-arginine translocation signal domain-containing protein [Halalkalicoccus sp. NIPERK01]|uniref:twin-arginine translocation signal domain-containing protein n=1 Tax=Halalkalicoccus sp. NIPERK01 TaxID=3053469 RepID=UPI00256ED4DA|nr:twin-arginine translocation signal domain-containing protein [Halalkalicoccus sp. NIPERK01]MDL5363323.1 twin-arginine translocation signal domain-containing protein [Halalkalicoccus sp. NIPERK01]
MVERTTTDEAELQSNWTRRTFVAALGATGIAAATGSAQASDGDVVAEVEETSDGSVDLRAFDEVLGRLERAADALEFPARRIGATPRGEQHGATHWGIHFETEKAIHLGEATVDADESGTFRAVVGRYDGDSHFAPVHERDVSVDAGLNTIDLDMALEPGEYLLTRDGSFPLRRAAWSGWESQSRDGLELKGGANPNYADNRYWYYYFDLNVAAHEDAHL